MKINSQIAAFVTAVMLLAGAATAQADHDYEQRGNSRAQYDYARVLSAQPIVKYVTVTTPVRECWEETRYHTNRYYPRNGPGTLLGAIIGGVIGHQVGSGRGNDAATIAGALIGAAVGNDAARQGDARYGNDRHSRQVERCETRYREHREERIDGYRVTYRYNGQKYRTEMPYDPGERIRVRVDVRPAG
jgi:uncharacterized protein YcfJ